MSKKKFKWLWEEVISAVLAMILIYFPVVLLLLIGAVVAVVVF